MSIVNRRRLSFQAILILCLALLLLVISTILLIRQHGFFFDGKYFEQRKYFALLWEKGNYSEIIFLSAQLLNNTPFDHIALIYGGFAHFYYGAGHPKVDVAQHHIEQSVILLRKALLKIPSQKSEIKYVLAKAYYHKGMLYDDVAVEYMKQSLDDGYIGANAYKYLGLAYARLKQYNQSIAWLHKALDEEQSDALLFEIAKAYLDTENLSLAEKYIQDILLITKDEFLIYQSRVLQGDILIKHGKYDEAMALFVELLENYTSAEIYYQLGKISSLIGDIGQARYQWREALRIDPEHLKAFRSLERS